MCCYETSVRDPVNAIVSIVKINNKEPIIEHWVISDNTVSIAIRTAFCDFEFGITYIGYL